MKNQEPCKNMMGELIVLNNLKATQLYNRKEFEPYNTLKFEVKAEKSGKTVSADAYIVGNPLLIIILQIFFPISKNLISIFNIQ